MDTTEYWHHIARHTPLALLLDMDGTLLALASTPEQARPDGHVRGLLADLAAADGVRCAVVSGRPRDSLAEMLGDVPSLQLVAEHGMWRWDGAGWAAIAAIDCDTLDQLQAMLEPLVRAQPGALLERKTSSVCVHYRLVGGPGRDAFLVSTTSLLHQWLAAHRAYELLDGAEAMEVRARQVHKGSAVAWAREGSPAGSASAWRSATTSPTRTPSARWRRATPPSASTHGRRAADRGALAPARSGRGARVPARAARGRAAAAASPPSSARADRSRRRPRLAARRSARRACWPSPTGCRTCATRPSRPTAASATWAAWSRRSSRCWPPAAACGWAGAGKCHRRRNEVVGVKTDDGGSPALAWIDLPAGWERALLQRLLQPAPVAAVSLLPGARPLSRRRVGGLRRGQRRPSPRRPARSSSPTRLGLGARLSPAAARAGAAPSAATAARSACSSTSRSRAPTCSR